MKDQFSGSNTNYSFLYSKSNYEADNSDCHLLDVCTKQEVDKLWPMGQIQATCFGK